MVASSQNRSGSHLVGGVVYVFPLQRERALERAEIASRLDEFRVLLRKFGAIVDDSHI